MIENITTNLSTPLHGINALSPDGCYTVQKACTEKCAEFKLQIISTMNDRLFIVLSLIAFVLLIRVFANLFWNKKPSWMIWIDNRLDVILLVTSLFLIGYLYFF